MQWTVNSRYNRKSGRNFPGDIYSFLLSRRGNRGPQAGIVVRNLEKSRTMRARPRSESFLASFGPSWVPVRASVWVRVRDWVGSTRVYLHPTRNCSLLPPYSYSTKSCRRKHTDPWNKIRLDTLLNGRTIYVATKSHRQRE